MMKEEIIKYTVDIDSMDKIVPIELIYHPLFDKKTIQDLINPYDIKVLFGRKQEKVMIGQDKNKDYYIINPYVIKDFKNVSYIKILNCVFPRFYNTVKFNEFQSIKSDVLSQRFIIMRLEMNNNSLIYSTNSTFNGDYIKLKVKYAPNENDKYLILEPLFQDKPFYFKSGNLKNIDRINIKFYDDEFNPIVLNFEHFFNDDKKDKNLIKQFIKDYAVNINIEIGCYENNMVIPNDY